MKKRHIFTLVNLFVLVFGLILLVVWLAAPQAVLELNLGWIGAIITGGWAISFTVRVFFEEQVVLKKSWVILAGVFYVMMAGSIIGACVVQVVLILPIICLAAAAAAFIGALALGGKKWDEGDNEKPGYKTYRERKAEEEALKAEEAKKAEEKDENTQA